MGFGRGQLVAALVGVRVCLMFHNVVSADYGAALTKSLLYYEGQRSGKLPPNQRLQWRADSGLKDGQDVNIDLVGGYYDAGDNLKLGFPMAFTITMLSWSTIEFRDKLAAKNELSNALAAIKWGTDYLVKAHIQPDVLYGEVGDADSDHACWQRPEDMTTPRSAFRIDSTHPGSDLAAETAAAFAAASIAFQPLNAAYASQLRSLMQLMYLFEFARDKPGIYQDSIQAAKKVYASSGYQDEMVWAAAWLHRASGSKTYLDYLAQNSPGGQRSSFSWDDKYVGAQILVAKLVLEGKVDGKGTWGDYKSQAEKFICSCAQKAAGGSNVKKTPGGLLWFLPWDNLQYVATATFSLSVYSQYLAAHNAIVQCDAGTLSPSDLTSFVKSQADYILGSNPRGMSYMVGYGSNYPQKIHHRGASIVSVKKDPSPVTCKGGYAQWFNRNEANPNVLEGAMVSPDSADHYDDSRSDYRLAEPTTVTNAPMVGVFAFLA
ncbi:endoglucanase 15-like [Neltuma alba]|uniref:endoglucanase 15-like n=1 Tax=Neltuma alba TaxID=207710 RepID=UPI0010A2E7EB|nr:endoglucanase 15-like [Prosopis alba]